MCARVFQFLIAKVPDMEAALTSQQIDDIIGKVNIRYVISAIYCEVLATQKGRILAS